MSHEALNPNSYVTILRLKQMMRERTAATSVEHAEIFVIAPPAYQWPDASTDDDRGKS